MINLNSSPNKLPMYVQISELLIRDMSAGRLLDGERLPPELQLAALVSPHWCNPARIAEAFPRKLLYVNIFNERASDRIRTDDRRFTKPLLYQLSYTGFFRKT